MSQITIHKLNDVFLEVECSEESVAKELSEYFTFYAPGYKYHPAFKKGFWDGKIRLWNGMNKRLYVGLHKYVLQFAEERGYVVSTDLNTDPNPFDGFVDFIQDLNLHSNSKKITPHPHQISAILQAFEKKRRLILSPTASGKSLVIYCLLRKLESETDKKILVVVPTVSLVSQLFTDFIDYSTHNGWETTNQCHQIFEGRPKETNKKIVLSTWQSLYKMPKTYFDQFDAVIIDECHKAKADSLRGILEKMTKCPYRIGMTGTLDGMQTNKLIIEGLLGPSFRAAYTKTLIDQNLISDCKIKCVVLKYPESYSQKVVGMKYQDEIDLLIGLPERNKFIVNLTKTLTGNTLVLFRFVEKHGKPLYEEISKANPGKQVFFVYGDVPALERERIRRVAEKDQNCIIVASYQTFATGINIPSLKHLILASPTKARIQVLQSIGRVLRKHSNKVIATIFDISDDMSYKSTKNFGVKHFLERIKYYKQERIEYEIFTVPLNIC